MTGTERPASPAIVPRRPQSLTFRGGILAVQLLGVLVWLTYFTAALMQLIEWQTAQQPLATEYFRLRSNPRLGDADTQPIWLVIPFDPQFSQGSVILRVPVYRRLAAAAIAAAFLLYSTSHRRVGVVPGFGKAAIRGVLWASVLALLISVCLLAVAREFGETFSPLLAPLPACLFILTTVAGTERRRADSTTNGSLRRARWRPECPECGYSIFRAARPRCPECGTPYLTPNTVWAATAVPSCSTLPGPARARRRWAVRRITWERRQRGFFIAAWFRTLLHICIRPGDAGRRCAIPDRFGRAFVWGCLHLLLFAGLATLFGSKHYYLSWLSYRTTGTGVPIKSPSPGESESAVVVATWFVQSWFAWFIALGSLPTAALLVSAWTARVHRAPVAGYVKWSFYVCAVLGLRIGAAIACDAWFAFRAWCGVRAGRFWPPPPEWADWLSSIRFQELALLYGLWWAIGCAWNPYQTTRGWTVLVGRFATFMTLWWLLTSWLFAPGLLKELL